MDDLFGILIVLGTIVFGLAGKYMEQRKQAKEEQARPKPRPTAADLPEKTRRMLFGTPEPPPPRPSRRIEAPERPSSAPVYQPRVARPAQRPSAPPAPPPVVVTAARRQFQDTDEGPKGMQRPQASAPTPRSQAPAPTPRPQAPVPVRNASQARLPDPRVGAFLKLKNHPVAPPPSTLAKPDVPAPQHRKHARVQPVRVPAPSDWVATLDDVRRGCILSEILGPPVSLR